MLESVAREEIVDLAARQLGIDPLELRRRNVIHQDDLPFTMPTGLPLAAPLPRPHISRRSASRVCGSPNWTTNPGMARWIR